MHTRTLAIISIFSIALAVGCSNDGAMFNGGQTGKGGSMTRFAINGNFMYIVDDENIHVYNILPGSFEKVNTVFVWSGLETIFSRGEWLYIGANDAMYIFSIADPALPELTFRYSHVTSCDPVVVQGNRAYVTLRNGQVCNRGDNALEIIDISDPYHPSLVKNYPMQSPHGLGVDGNRLFICEGEHGLKVFDITDELNIQLIAHLKDFFAYDVIPVNGLATVTGNDGIFQLRYDVEGEPVMLSTIPVAVP